MLHRFFSTKWRPPISITTCAWDKITEIVAHSENSKVIFSATSGGCNGFNYNLKLLDEPTYQNLALAQGVIPLTILKNNTTRVVIDPVSEMVLLGTTIDYVREDYAEGRFENKFVFIPDRDLATSCGCGVSFTPRD